jgi:hypothetical protein
VLDGRKHRLTCANADRRARIADSSCWSFIGGKRSAFVVADAYIRIDDFGAIARHVSGSDLSAIALTRRGGSADAHGKR